MSSELFETLSRSIKMIYTANGIDNVDIDKYLIFDIVDNNNIIMFKPRNIICGLWLNQIFPMEYDFIGREGMFFYNDVKYTFDYENCELMMESI